MKNRHLTIYVGDQEPRDKPAFLWIHRDPVTGYILFQINNGIDSWETITDSSMIAENMQHTLDILNDYIEDAQEAIEAAEQLAQDMSTHAVPYIGDNGNWFTWNYQTSQYEDTGKQAKGDTGAQGTQGPHGEPGPAGPQGPQGNTGASVDYPYELVNNRTTDDATKGLTAAEGKRLGDDLSQLGQEVTDLTRDNLDADFSISDENAKAIVQFKNGHIKTKNFDSSKVGTEVETEEDYDFGIKDENNNILLMLKDGGIKTKNFNSEELQNIADVVDRYRGKIFSLLGDSISTFGTPSATNEDGTYCYSYYPSASCRYSEDGVDSIAFDVNNTYWMKLIKRTGMVLGINDSYRGTKVAGTSNAFNLQTRIDHLGENGTPDVILVYGGANDAGGGVTIGTFNTEDPANYTDTQIASLPVTTFADAYRTMLIRLMKKYPLAEIVVILPTFTTSYYTITNLDLYVEIIKEACDFFGIKYIDARCTGINIYNKASYLVDGIHPNVAGMDLLFKKIYKQLIFN